MSSFRPFLWSALLFNFILIGYLFYKEINASVLVTNKGALFFYYFLLLECPHYFMTLMRTHLDRGEFKQNRKLHTLGFIAILGAVYAWQLYYPESLNSLFVYFTAWHIYQQNKGFLALNHYQMHVPTFYVEKESQFHFFMLIQIWALAHFVTVLPFDLGLIILAGIIFVNMSLFRIEWAERNFYIIGTFVMYYWMFQPHIQPWMAIMGGGLYHAIQYLVFMWAYGRVVKKPFYLYILIYCGGVAAAFAGLQAYSASSEGLIFTLIKGLAVYHAIGHSFIWQDSDESNISGLTVIQIFERNPHMRVEEKIEGIRI
jgi:hypothetical protein